VRAAAGEPPQPLYTEAATIDTVKYSRDAFTRGRPSSPIATTTRTS